MSKEPKYVTEEDFYDQMANLYDAADGVVQKTHTALLEYAKKLEDRIVVLEALTRGMRLPDELDIAGQTYVKKERS